MRHDVVLERIVIVALDPSRVVAPYPNVIVAAIGAAQSAISMSLPGDGESVVVNPVVRDPLGTGLRWRCDCGHVQQRSCEAISTIGVVERIVDELVVVSAVLHAGHDSRGIGEREAIYDDVTVAG